MSGMFKKWLSKITEKPPTQQSVNALLEEEVGTDIQRDESDTEEKMEDSAAEIFEDETAEGVKDLLHESAPQMTEVAEDGSKNIWSEASMPSSEVLEGEALIVEETYEETFTETMDETMDETMEETIEEAVEEAVEETMEAVPEPSEERQATLGFFERLKSGLSKTSKAITDRIDLLLNDYGKIDEELYEELEEILITADIGMETTMSLIDNLKKALIERRISDASEVKGVLRDVMVDTLKTHSDTRMNLEPSPAILFVIGVNGSGKTTTIGKIAYKLKQEGKTVMLAAADTFRAAAIDQLKIWGERSGVPVISHQEGSDPAAVVFDAIQAAKARKIDVLICDTAGRLHNKKNLMNELAKIFRVIERDYPEAKREVLLVLDATTGQNGLQQAKIFKETANITGIALTKLDGTAKGGVVLSILHEVEIPVKLIGVGEGMNDLQPFNPEKFVDALLDLS
jgi:fused signal recognition particle receptor